MALFIPSTRRTRLRKLLAHRRSAAVVVIATALASVLCGAGPISAGGPSPAASERSAEPDWIAQLPSGGGEDVSPADTLNTSPPAEQQQVAPDTTTIPPQAQPSTPPDTTTAAPTIQAISVPDTLGTAPADTLHPLSTTPDSTNAALRVPAQTAVPDTLFPTTPGHVLPAGPQGTVTTQPHAPQGPPVPPPKPRTGLFGIHPIAILVGLAALHYAVIHLVE
jgi:hypothetical protein